MELEAYGHSKISIHALREEGDINVWKGTSERPNFYPRPPRGGRPMLDKIYHAVEDFYPRPPRGGRPALVK